MFGDDSFNDSDEIFNLYSSKKVTDTFKAQFKKLVSNNAGLRNNFKVSNNEDVSNKSENTPSSGEKLESIEETGGLIKKSTFRNTSPSVINVCESHLDESIEIVEENIPKTNLRRSERQRKKKGVGNNESSGTMDHFCTKKNVKSSCRGRKKSVKERKKHNKCKSPIDEIVLNDSEQSDHNIDEDEVNPEITVKVIWKSVSVKKFKIRKFQKISKIFEELSREENIAEEKIMLTFNNVKVNPNDTPDSLNMQVFHFLDGGVLSELTNCSDNLQSQASSHNDITLKFQDVNKKLIKITQNVNDKMKVGMIKCSEQLEIQMSKIRFYFDGEPLDPSQTPASLGLDNDEIIDIKICE